MGMRTRTDVERQVEALAVTIDCPQPICEVPAGQKCQPPSGSSHLGRVRAVGALGLMPLVAAWDRGELW